MLLVISFSSFFNRMIAPGPSVTPIRVIMIDEISVTSHEKGKNLFVESIPVSYMSLDELPSSPMQKGWEFYSKVHHGYDRKLFKNWLNIMYDYPIEYLNAKIDMFLHCISFPLKYIDAYAYYIRIDSPEKLHNSKFRSILEKPIKFCMEHKIFGIYILRAFFLPIFWIPLGFVSFAVGIYRNDISGRLMALISSSGIFYFLSYLATPSTPDYRYFLWSFLAIIVSLGIWLYAPKRKNIGARAAS